MHRHGRIWRASTELRRLKAEAVADGLLLIPIVLLFAFAPSSGWAPAWEIVLLVGANAVASLVRFEIGTGSTSPIQLVMVPLWFAVPPAWLPVLVGLSYVIGSLIENVRDGDFKSLGRSLLSAGDAWPSIGSAVVLAIAGSPGQASMGDIDIAVLAFAGQVVVDVILCLAMGWWFHGVAPRHQIRIQQWIVAVDAALAPIGFVVAVAMTTQPVAFICVLPLIAVIGEFARERQNRLEQAFQLSNAYRGTAQLMGDVLEADDSYTGGEHTQGVVDMAVAIGLELRLSPREMRDLEFGALLHDIGKLRIPNDIINKPGALDSREWGVIRMHPEYGQEMLDRVGGALTDAGRIVRAHHERWDGLGYPDRLAAEDIPLAARIISACDSFSAMTTTRSYSPAMSHEDGLAELARCSGTQFDPRVVDALVMVLERDPWLRGHPGERPAIDPASSPIGAALGLRPLL